MGARSKGKSGNSMLPIFIKGIFLQKYVNVCKSKTFSFRLGISSTVWERVERATWCFFVLLYWYDQNIPTIVFDN
jgi:hypothetical protein